MLETLAITEHKGNTVLMFKNQNGFKEGVIVHGPMKGSISKGLGKMELVWPETPDSSPALDSYLNSSIKAIKVMDIENIPQYFKHEDIGKTVSYWLDSNENFTIGDISADGALCQLEGIVSLVRYTVSYSEIDFVADEPKDFIYECNHMAEEFYSLLQDKFDSSAITPRDFCASPETEGFSIDDIGKPVHWVHWSKTERMDILYIIKKVINPRLAHIQRDGFDPMLVSFHEITFVNKQ